jgi:hypothetical protein
VPLVSTQAYVLSLIDGLIVPGFVGTIEAFITPLDPDEESGPPKAYIWPATGTEQRQSLPRENAPNVVEPGFKEITHDIDVFVVWFASDDDPMPDANFPSVIDAVMGLLRGSANPAVLYDPLAGTVSQLVNLGERMVYDIATPRSTADQRMLRYDARITLTVLEELQRSGLP